MKKINTINFITVTLIALLVILSFTYRPSSNAFDKSRISYMEYCAGCHGYQLEEFANKSQWIYGISADDLFKTIKYGRDDIGMPSFSLTFSDEEIKGLTQFVLSGGKSDKFTEEFNDKNYDIIKSEKQNFRIDTVISGLEVPWGMTWLPNGDMLITERSGILYRLSNNNLTIVEGTPLVYHYGQGGLLDIELHPDYEKNGWIYISYSYYAGETIDDGGSTAIMRCRLKNDQLADQEILFKAEPYEKKGVHFGSRIEFDKDGYLYFTVGDRGRSENAQLLTNHSGCVHRIKDDGGIPEDNPFLNVAGAKLTIYNYGHRNIQGLAINPVTGDLWSHEHGPKGGDEVNVEKPGKNYGWPEITFGINYNGTIITEDTAKSGMEQPIIYWVPSIAPCGMDFVEGNKYKNWEGNLLVGSLRFKYLARCEIKNNKIVHQEKLLEDIGRVRNVKIGPDGYIYVAVEFPGKIIKIIPVE